MVEVVVVVPHLVCRGNNAHMYLFLSLCELDEFAQNWFLDDQASDHLGVVFSGSSIAYVPSKKVAMWVFEEEIKQKDGSMKKISEIINEEHENVKCHTLFFSCRTGFVQMHDETCVLVRLPIMFYHDVLIFW